MIDFYNYPRPYGEASEIDAFEFNPAYYGIHSVEPEVVTMPLPFPNPVRTTLSICYRNDQKADVSLSINKLLGALVKNLKQKSVNAGSHAFKEDVGNYKPGIFIYTIRSANYAVTGKFIKADFQK